jgi:hypothetical protein
MWRKSVETPKPIEKIAEPIREMGHIVLGHAEVAIDKAPSPIKEMATVVAEVGQEIIRLPGKIIENIKIGNRLLDGQDVKLAAVNPKPAPKKHSSL